jgi:methylmalonyl-CoA mutase
MYAVRPWTIRQYAGFSTAEESNAFYRAGAGRRADRACRVAFDLATHRGYDSDHPRVTGDVGKAGVAIDSVEDMKILFDGIPLDKVIGVDDHERRGAAGAGRCYVVAAEEQGVAAAQARRDHPERHPQGVHGPQHLHLPARALACASSRDIFAYTARADAEVQLHLDLRLPHAGGGRDQADLELAFTLADGMEYVRSRRWPRASTSTTSPAACRFFWAIGMNFFMEVAKMRAARLLWCAAS